MPNKEFLEKYPLYRKFKTDWCSEGYTYSRKTFSNLPKPAIHMHCDVCGSDQTFNMVNEYYENDYFYLEDHSNEFSSMERLKKIGLFKDKPVAEKIARLDYLCSACSRGERVFLVRFFAEKKGDNSCLSMVKVGQYPSWDIEMDKELEKILGEYAEYYRRGLICESQSYGIGAYAYFRRVTEDVIDDLLESILDLVEEGEKEQYKEKLEEVKKEKIAEKKIDLVKDLLPKSLQVGGMNPLKELYGILSQGIHDETDEECIEKAEVIRGILVFLVNQVIRTKKDKKSFTEGMKKILGK